MKSLWIGAAAAIAILGPGAAGAADIAARPYTKAPMMAEPIFSWTGYYLGVNAGYGWSESNDISTTGQATANVNNVLGGARPGTVRVRQDGFVGGGQIGYNYQFAPSWVFGVEADIAYTDMGRSTSVTTVPLSGVGSLNNVFSNNLEYLGTVRGRLGYTVGQTMFYGTGGFAYGEVNNGASLFGSAATGNNLQFTGSSSQTRTGYAVGGGIEHAISQNWTVKAEYLYYDLGRNTVNVAVIPGAAGAGGTGYNSSFRTEGNIVRAGLNYKFGGPAVARY